MITVVTFPKDYMGASSRIEPTFEDLTIEKPNGIREHIPAARAAAEWIQSAIDQGWEIGPIESR